MSKYFTEEMLNDPNIKNLALRFLNNAVEQGGSLKRASKITNNKIQVYVDIRYKDCRTGDDNNKHLCHKCHGHLIRGDIAYVPVESKALSTYQCPCQKDYNDSDDD